MDLVLEALRLAVRNAESRLYHAAPLGACHGQPERASLETELERYQRGLAAYEGATLSDDERELAIAALRLESAVRCYGDGRAEHQARCEAVIAKLGQSK